MPLRSFAALLLVIGSSAPALAQSYGGSYGGSYGLQQPAALFHGNYCGMGNNAPLPPVDALDAACARHDACSPQGGLPSRACNARLRWEADRISRDPRQPDDLRTLAGFVAAGTALMPFDLNTPVAAAQVPASVRYGAPRAYRSGSYAY